ncbi:DNA-binding domain-containing protein [Dyella sp. GSA-30]|uniref:HvfC/BufC N-terminal domain-containing protein n=1 Tax=Dyella sp. GSA-30 TaxID=2994496 RepID=UPI002490429D|nr:DNA-binding domain-containing protein [Dyella sp. GSA-30]BDU18802.1 hypothetical protein DYGSA30_02590 [Dyella sp. GSA-30]
MTLLRDIQQQVLHAMLAEQAPPLEILRGDERADAATRFAVYHHAYRARLLEALAIEYPGLALMAGRRFERLGAGYLEAHPSGHYNIRWHGAGLAAFLDYGRPWRDKPAFADMARLDWAISTVFDAADEPVMDPQALAQLAPEDWARLLLHPQYRLQILSTSYNVAAFRKAADLGEPKPKLVHYSTAQSVLIWRQEWTVRYRTLEDDELIVLEAAIGGATFSELCDRLGRFHDESAAPARMVAILQGWLASHLLRAHTV